VSDTLLWQWADIKGLSLHAEDGPVGEVVDLLFDDRTFKVRWAVVDTGSWLPGRKVLLPPATLSAIDFEGRSLRADVSRSAVERAPDLSAHEPVSRQHEADLFAHYSWTPYWSVAGMTTRGAALHPVPPAATGVPDLEPAAPADPAADLARGADGEPELRSIGEVEGYSIHASDGFVGEVTGSLIDSGDWVVRYLVVDTRKWLPGKHVLLSPSWVRSIGWLDHEVRVDHSRDEVKAAPEYTPAMTVHRAFEDRLHRHYGVTPYWI